MSAPLSGPAQNIGIQLKEGAELYFQQYNETPEGKRTPISLITYDDGYEPYLTMINTKKFIEEDNVFSLFSYVGTPNTMAIMPLIAKQNILLFSPYTGADFLRLPVHRHIFNIRASYYQEALTQIEYFIGQQQLSDIALFIQADEFGLAASRGYAKALKHYGISKFRTVRYKRNSKGIEEAAKHLITLNPEIIFCIGTYEPIALMINKIRSHDIKSKVAIVSFASEKSVQKSLKSFEEVYITSTMPNPNNSKLALIKQYRAAMKDKEISNESLEGYINAATFVDIISKTSPTITTQSFINTAEKLSFDKGGMDITFSSLNHQALNTVFLNKITKDNIITIPLSH